MSNYHISIDSKTQGKMVLLTKYSEFGELCFVEIRELRKRVGKEALQWVYSQLPVTEGGIESLKRKPRITVQQIEADLSFTTFWNLYDYKVGKKDRAEKTWNSLDDATRIIALKRVKEYKHWMLKQTINRMYPESWLAQQRWNNEYK